MPVRPGKAGRSGSLLVARAGRGAQDGICLQIWANRQIGRDFLHVFEITLNLLRMQVKVGYGSRRSEMYTILLANSKPQYFNVLLTIEQDDFAIYPGP